MKVLFLNPPFLPLYSRSSRSPAVTKSATLYYPIYLSYAAAAVQADGFEVLLIDAPAMDLDHEAVMRRIKAWSPDFTVVDTSTPSIQNDVQMAEAIKTALGKPVCLVGTHVSALPEETLRMSATVDFAAIHEYDYTVRDLARLYAKVLQPAVEKIAAIPGIAYRAGNAIQRTPDRPYIDNLDSIPFVAKIYKQFLSKHIRRYFYGSTRYPVMAILSGRGCPYSCAYCVYPQTLTGHKYRLRSVKNVVDEMEYIRKEFPEIKEIFLEDDTLTVNKKRCLELSEEIQRRNLKITWTTNSRADADFETLDALKKAGLRLVCVGFESGDQAVLDNIGKKITPAQMVEFGKNAKKAGILIHGCFLVGNQGETKETLQKTLDMAMKINPDTAQFYPIMVYPGTKAYKWADCQGYIRAKNWREWLTEDGQHNTVVSTPELSAEELVRFCDQARRKFYLRPGYVISKGLQALTHPREAKRILRAAKTFAKFLLKKEDKKKECGCR